VIGWLLFLAAFAGVYVRIALKAALQLSVMDYRFRRIIPLSYVSQLSELVIIGADALVVVRRNPVEILAMIAVMGTAAWCGAWTSMWLHRRFS